MCHAFAISNGVHDALLIIFLQELPEVCLVSFDQDFKAIESLKVIS